MVQRKSLSPGIRTAPPEFRKMFNDMRVMSGQPCRLEIVVTGNPRPKVLIKIFWKLNLQK